MFICERCGKKIKRKTNFIRHLQRKYTCKPILSDVTTKELLLKHTKKIVKKFECEFCNKKFTRKNNLIVFNHEITLRNTSHDIIIYYFPIIF